MALRRTTTCSLVFKEKIGLLANDFGSAFERVSGRVGWVKAFCIKKFGSPPNADIPLKVGRLSRGERHRAGTMRTKITKRRQRHGLLVFKEKIGLLANDCCSAFERGSGRVGWVKLFCIKQFGSPPNADIPRATKEFVRRSRNMVRSSQYLVGKLSRGERHGAGTMRTKFTKRRGRHGLHGRPPKMPELRHLLFQWFVDIRSVKSRLTNRVVLAAAREIIKDIQGAALREGRLVPVPPNIDHPMWLRRWQTEFGIGLKHPTRRFKISRGSKECDVSVGCRCGVGRRGRVGCRRSRGLPQEGMAISFDQKGVYFNSTSSSSTAISFDQKPVYFDSTSSSSTTTVHHGGAGSVDINTNHAQSRSRFSYMVAQVAG